MTHENWKRLQTKLSSILSGGRREVGGEAVHE